MSNFRRYGEQCPAYKDWHVKGDGGLTCEYCDGCLSMNEDGVECGYSPTPTTVPKYKKGQYAYKFFHLDYFNCGKIREVNWDGRFQWEYIFDRDRIPHKESRVFATKQEAMEYVMIKHAQHLYNEISEYKKIYGQLPQSINKIKLIGNE